MCFHLIVYIPLCRLSPHSICIVARGFCANNRVSAYAWPVFTEPTGPIRHRKRKRNTENDVILSQCRPFSLYIFTSSDLSAFQSPTSFSKRYRFYSTRCSNLTWIVSPYRSASEKSRKHSLCQIPHDVCLFLALKYDRFFHVSFCFSTLKYVADKGSFSCCW